jgi:DNA-directed RNA polymerase subunit RPC12/RpoP
MVREQPLTLAATSPEQRGLNLGLKCDIISLHTMKFHCQNCGKEIRVPSAYAGKKGRCPECKAALIVPSPQVAAADEVQLVPKSPLDDLTFLDVPQQAKIESEPTEQPDSTEEAYEQFQKLYGGFTSYQNEDVQERKLPWIADIFLYPMNLEGLTIILMSAGIPLLLRMLQEFLRLFSHVFLPMYVFFVLAAVIQWISVGVFILYVLWYFYECVCSSAAGQVRAPQTAGCTPGLWEMLGKAFRTIACFIFFMLPSIFYMGSKQQFDDPVYWLLVGLGIFLFPMGLLAVAVFDSVCGVNPILILGSIFSTFFQYCALVAFCYAFFLLIPLAGYFMRHVWILGYLFMLVAFYLGLILAHLLGRFGFKYRDKLNWEV